MEFGIKDRITLSSILAGIKGDYVTITLADNLVRKLQLTEEEMDKSGMTAKPDGSLSWIKDVVVDIPIGNKTLEVVKTQLQAKEQAKALEANILPLYRKFVGSPDVKDD